MMTDEQRAVVDAPLEAHLLVMAAAGTGKTHVLAERLSSLAANDAIAGQELLVLSFSRAVVRELRRRLAASTGRARLVQPQTFDSFATRLLAALPPRSAPPEWRSAGYSGRITAATSAVRDDAEAKAVIGGYRHVFVDEIQDLVGIRASFVRTLLGLAGGFTLFGDPAQAIYDHSVRAAADTTTSDGFLSLVRKDHPDLRTLHLTQNFRAQTGDATAVAPAGALLRLPRPDRPAARAVLADVTRVLPHIRNCGDLAVAVRNTTRRVAILARTNDTALAVMEELWQNSAENRLQRSAADPSIPGWLALVLQGEERRVWSKPRWTELVERRQGIYPNLPDPESSWQAVTDLTGDPNNLDVDAVRQWISLGGRSELSDLSAPVIVSTVHRAKGLEFDDVFVASPHRDVEDIDDLEELRILYVALSRARNDVWIYNPPDTALWRPHADLGDRWVKSPWQARWKTLGFEIRPADVDPTRPFGTGCVPADPLESQSYLIHEVHRGDPITLHLVDTEDEAAPVYTARHCHTPIGETTQSFAELLRRRLKGTRDATKWPRAMEGLRCDGVDTVAGLPAEGHAAGLGSSGLWLRPNIVGLATIQWHTKDEEA
jgi:hypothetical protein